MKKKLITFGLASKKLFFPFLLALTQIIFDIFNEYYPEVDKNCIKDCEKIQNNVLNSCSLNLGGMFIIIIPYIKKFSDKNEQFEIKITKTKCMIFIHYSILVVFAMIIILLLVMLPNRIEEENIISPHLYGLYSREGFEIICYVLLLIFF